jgi:hypothetical protein
MKNLFKIAIVIICLSIFIFSCESKTYEEIQPAKVVITEVTYQKDIKAIMTASCISCHSVAGGTPPNLETYDEVKVETEAPGTVICRMEASCGNVMPKSGKLPQATIDKIKFWSTTGYKN